MKKTISIIVGIIIIFILAALVFDWGRNDNAMPDNTNVSAEIATDSMMIISYPLDNQEVESPINVSGTVSGTWFSQGGFPIELVDSDGNIIGTTTAQNESGTTSGSVDFSASISYPHATTTDHAFLLLANENPNGNPSGLQEKFVPLILK